MSKNKSKMQVVISDDEGFIDDEVDTDDEDDEPP
jgi:hypothetical protein